jgi:hypothetical protein
LGGHRSAASGRGWRLRRGYVGTTTPGFSGGFGVQADGNQQRMALGVLQTSLDALRSPRRGLERGIALGDALVVDVGNCSRVGRSGRAGRAAVKAARYLPAMTT